MSNFIGDPVDFIPTSRRDMESYSPTFPAPTDTTQLLTKLLEGGLAASVEKLVRQQFELVAAQMPQSVGRHPPNGADEIQPFDPDNPDCDMERWILAFDELGERFAWSDYDKTQLLKSKMAGRGRQWASRLDLDNPDLTWNDWKKQLWMTFPRRDFADTLEELVLRRKYPNETVSEYFKDKVALCGRCGFEGQKAVSCVIRGLPEEMRPGAYALRCPTPALLYSEYLVGFDGFPRPRDEQGPKAGRYSPPGEALEPPVRQFEEGRYSPPMNEETGFQPSMGSMGFREEGRYSPPRKQRPPRRSREWRESKGERSGGNEKKVAVNKKKSRWHNSRETSSNLTKAGAVPPRVRCLHCGKGGHTISTCWNVKFQTKNPKY